MPATSSYLNAPLRALPQALARYCANRWFDLDDKGADERVSRIVARFTGVERIEFDAALTDIFQAGAF